MLMEIVLRRKPEIKMKSRRLHNDMGKSEFKLRIAREKQEANYYSKVGNRYYLNKEIYKYVLNYSFTLN